MIDGYMGVKIIFGQGLYTEILLRGDQRKSGSIYGIDDRMAIGHSEGRGMCPLPHGVRKKLFSLLANSPTIFISKCQFVYCVKNCT